MSVLQIILLVTFLSLVITAGVVFYIKREFLDFRFSLSDLTTTICLDDIKKEINNEDEKKDLAKTQVVEQIQEVPEVVSIEKEEQVEQNEQVQEIAEVEQTEQVQEIAEVGQDEQAQEIAEVEQDEQAQEVSPLEQQDVSIVPAVIESVPETIKNNSLKFVFDNDYNDYNDYEVPTIIKSTLIDEFVEDKYVEEII